MVTDLQKRTAQAIVNIFETGHPQGDYGKVTLLVNDWGHLTYGRSQTTLASGNLHLLIKAYCETPGAALSADLGEFLDRLASRDTSLDNDMTFRNLLKEAGDDPIMHDVQDQFFDRVYWNPSVQAATAISISTALGIGVVYDSSVHGSWRMLRDRTNDRHGLVTAINETTWVTDYVNERKDWLATNPNPLLRQTVYRMTTFQDLIGADKWDLNLPFPVRGVLLDEDVLTGGTPVRASAQDEDERTLLLLTPPLRGNDVKELQQRLVDAGFSVTVDGVFGSRTDDAVKRFQQSQGLKADGIVGPVTRTALGL